MSDALTLTYTEDPTLNAAADAVAFPPPSQRAIWRDRIIYGLAGGLVIFFFEIILEIPVTLRDGIAFGVGAMFVNFVVIPIIFKARRKAKLQAQEDGPIVLTLTSDGFQAGSNFGHFFVRWHDGVHIFKLEFGIAIVWDNVALAVPQSAIPHGMTLDDLYAKIADWHKDAKA